MHLDTTVPAFLIFLAGAVLIAGFIQWYRRQHPHFDPNARFQWRQAFDFERAGYIVVGLSVTIFVVKHLLFPGLGPLSDFMLGATSGLAAMQYHSYDPNTTPGRDVHYVG